MKYRVYANLAYFGIIEADSEQEARDQAARAAGYKSEEDMVEQLESPSEISVEEIDPETEQALKANKAIADADKYLVDAQLPDPWENSMKLWESKTKLQADNINGVYQVEDFDIEFPNSFMPAKLSWMHAASSYSMPVLVDGNGAAYGPADALPDTMGMPWLNSSYGLPQKATAGDLVRVHIIEGFGGQDRPDNLIDAAKKFLGMAK